MTEPKPVDISNAGGSNDAPRRWLNRNVAGMGVTSLLADVGYEMVTSVLPGFMSAIGAQPVHLGFIEGLADAMSSGVKLGMGHISDRIGKRKSIVVVGYFITGAAQGIFALAMAWPLVLAARMAAWTGKGIRGPLRDAMLAESVATAHRGKAFGFHRAADTLGAIIGPLLGAGALWLLARGATESTDPSAPYRWVFLLSLIPGIGSAIAFAAIVREQQRAADPAMRFWASLRSLPVKFRRALIGVGVFGAGDFSHTLLIVAAAESLKSAGMVPGKADAIGAALYALRNAAYAAASYPIGALSDRLGRRGLLIGGYLLAAVVMILFAATAATGISNIVVLCALFALAGTYIAVEDALEGAITADLVPDESVRGTAYGVMGAVNSAGDLISSVVFGAILAINPAAAFGYAAAMMLAGAILLRLLR